MLRDAVRLSAVVLAGVAALGTPARAQTPMQAIQQQQQLQQAQQAQQALQRQQLEQQQQQQQQPPTTAFTAPLAGGRGLGLVPGAPPTYTLPNLVGSKSTASSRATNSGSLPEAKNSAASPPACRSAELSATTGTLPWPMLSVTGRPQPS